jgi:hypothetical protein
MSSGTLKMKTIRTPKRRFKLMLQDAKSQKTALTNNLVSFDTTLTAQKRPQNVFIAAGTCLPSDYLATVADKATQTYRISINKTRTTQKMTRPTILLLLKVFVAVLLRLPIEVWCLLGCYAMWLFYEPTFRRNLAPPSSG